MEELEKIRKQEMFLEDRRGALNLAKREGREEGRIEGERSLLLRQLERRFGELPRETIALIEALNSQQLDALGEAIWDFNSHEDLLHWLQENSR